MSTDYIPDSAEHVLAWCNNYLTQIATVDPSDVPALTAQKRAKSVGPVTALRDVAQAVVNGRITQRALEAGYASKRAEVLPDIHEEAGDLKRMEGVTPGLIFALDISSHQTGLNRATYQPNLKVEVHAGHVALSAPKRGVKAMNYYMRRGSQGPWTLIAANRTKSPVRDDSPLAVSGVAERREYRCVGVIDDQEIGQPSDIVEVLYGG